MRVKLFSTIQQVHASQQLNAKALQRLENDVNYFVNIHPGCKVHWKQSTAVSVISPENTVESMEHDMMGLTTITVIITYYKN